MSDLDQTARLFQSSTRLQRASSALEQIARDETPEDGASQTLKWAADFLARLDLDAPVPAGDLSGGLTVQTVTARPAFYASLAKLGPELRRSGVKSSEDATAFIVWLLQLLRVGGQDVTTDTPRLRLAARFLRELSNGLLAHDEARVPSTIY